MKGMKEAERKKRGRTSLKRSTMALRLGTVFESKALDHDYDISTSVKIHISRVGRGR